MNKPSLTKSFRSVSGTSVFFRIATCFLMLVAISACSDDDFPAGAFDEKSVDITGTYEVNKVLRNGTDITALLDFSGFSLKLNAGSYTLNTGGSPFAVEADGTWKLDDPVYPQTISFNPDGSPQAIVDLNSPPISGGSNLSLAFSPGCNSNTYVFQLTKK